MIAADRTARLERRGALDHAQVAHARAYAEHKGWAVADDHVCIDVGISGTK